MWFKMEHPKLTAKKNEETAAVIFDVDWKPENQTDPLNCSYLVVELQEGLVSRQGEPGALREDGV